MSWNTRSWAVFNFVTWLMMLCYHMQQLSTFPTYCSRFCKTTFRDVITFATWLVNTRPTITHWLCSLWPARSEQASGDWDRQRATLAGHGVREADCAHQRVRTGADHPTAATGERRHQPRSARAEMATGTVRRVPDSCNLFEIRQLQCATWNTLQYADHYSTAGIPYVPCEE